MNWDRLLTQNAQAQNDPITGTDFTGWSDRLRVVLPPDALPALTRALDAGVFDDDPSGFPADEFAFGLDLILDGLERAAAR